MVHGEMVAEAPASPRKLPFKGEVRTNGFAFEVRGIGNPGPPVTSSSLARWIKEGRS